MNEFLHAYSEILSDPAHTAVELTFVAVDLVIIQRVQAGLRRLLKREHRAIDREHGVVHPGLDQPAGQLQDAV